MAKVAEDALKKKSNVLILAHRNSLLNQHRELFEQLELNNKNIRIQSVFTEVNHLGEYEKPDIIIIDEAHLSGASSYQKVCDYYNCIRVLFTATPARLDGKPLNLADSLVQGITIKELTKKGAIADFDYYAPDLKLNLDDIKLTAGEYNMEELEKEMDKPAIYGDILKCYKELGQDRQAIAYCVNIKHSQSVCKMFNDNGIKAFHIDASTKEKDRQQVLDDFKEGKFKILCNCNLISEGITLPTASVGLLLRPTCSLPLYIQQACRVLTPDGDKKAVIIDYVNNFEKHGLPNEEREWTLKGKVKKRVSYDTEGNLIIKNCQKCYKTFKGNLKACPYCGFENIPTKKELENKKEIELKKIEEAEAIKRKEERKQQGMAQDFGSLVRLAKERGYKNPAGWSYYIMQSRKKKHK